jgi:hypothetical protein
VANQAEAPGDEFLSLGWNQAKEAGGAVPPLASVRLRRAIKPGKAIPDGLHPSGKRPPPGIPESPAPAKQLVRRQRFSRLCVLMNPILPGLRSIRTWPA